MNIRPLPGWGSINWERTFPKSRGFTIIELILVISIIAITTSLALPSYRLILEKRQVTSGAEQISSFLSSVQLESIKRNKQVSVSYSWLSPGTWCIGTISGATACNCTVTDTAEPTACVIDSQLRVMNGDNLNNPKVMSQMAGDGTFVFEPVRGLMIDHSDGAEFELLSDNNSYGLNIRINATGRMKICSASSDRKVPGYEVCSS